jgi:hypothetical protein
MFMGRDSSSVSIKKASLGEKLSMFPLLMVHSAVASMTGLDWRLLASHKAGTSGWVSWFGREVMRLGKMFLAKRGCRRGWIPLGILVEQLSLYRGRRRGWIPLPESYCISVGR